MITVVHLDGLGGINYHRLIVPLLRLQKQGLDGLHFIKSLTKLKEMNLDKVDNLLVSRKLSVTNHKEFKKMLNENGIKLILDNDDYWNLNQENPAYALYETYYGPDIKKTIKIADVIWSPNRYLARQMRHINPLAKIEFINNAIDETEEQWFKQKKKSGDVLSFGYIGASSHTEDIKEMGYRFDGKRLYCMDGMGYEEIISASDTFPPRNIFEYAKAYRKIDVSLAPLKKNKFNRCKSNLKITEAAFTKTAIIASNVENYSWSVINGETGILCSTDQEWKEAVESMTKERSKMLGENLYESLKDDPHHNLDKVNEIRLKYLTE
jgi:glycosyltransferase involved in cell wall biosynthesis